MSAEIDPAPRRRWQRATKVGARLGLSPPAARRAGVTMADQCFASGTNFAVGVAVAHLAGPVGLGAFALAYACWILINTLHRALVTDPMAINRSVQGSAPSDSLRQGFAAEIVLGAAATAVIALIGAVLLACHRYEFGIGLLAVAPWVIALDLQDYWRWIGFMQGRPGKALANDVVFAIAQTAAFVIVYLAGVRSVFALVSAWGVGAVAGAVYGLWQFSSRPGLKGGYALLRQRWHMSRWLAGTQAANWGAGQLYLIIAAGILGPAALGGLKAAQNLVTGPSSVVIHAGGSFGLPEASRALEDRGWRGLRRVSLFVNAAGLMSIGFFGILVLFFGGPLLRIFYGPAFTQYEPAARLFVAAFVISGFGLGPGLVLKATKWTRPGFTVQLISLAVSVPAVFVLGELYGPTGAAASAVCSSIALMISLLLYQRAARLKYERDERTHGPETGSDVQAILDNMSLS